MITNKLKALTDLSPAIAMFQQNVTDGALAIDHEKIVTGEQPLNFAQLESVFTRAGNAAGDTERSGEELGVALFYSARAGLIDGSSVRPLYIKQRTAQAARAGVAFTLEDEKTAKTVTAQASKLGAFVHAAKHGKVTTQFMVNARHAARNLPKADKAISIYNALQTICRAQKDAKEEMTEEQMLALFAGEEKEEKTEMQMLESLLKACGKIGEKFPAADINATFAVINRCILTRKGEEVAKAKAATDATIKAGGKNADGTPALPVIIAAVTTAPQMTAH